MQEFLTFLLIYVLTSLLITSLYSPPKSLSQSDRKALISYFIAMIHSVSSVGLGLYSHVLTSGATYTQPDSVFQRTLITVTPTQHTIAYLAYDLALGGLNGILEGKMIAHHFFAIVGGVAVLAESTAVSSGISKT